MCGCIRFDALRLPGMPFSRLEHIKTLLGDSCSFDDPPEIWDQCNVPAGSEGSIQFFYYENPHKPSAAAFAVGIIGDLRDFGSDQVPRIKEWFERVINTDSPMVRNAILRIDVEGEHAPIILQR